MAVLALVLTGAWVGLVAGVPSYRRLRRTGDVGIDIRDRRGSPQWWARRISVLGVEEPCLRRIHGDAYRRYAAGTGRFLPRIGRLRP